MSMERGTITRLSLTRLSKRLGSLRNREYNKVEDLYDTRVPLHNEEAFEHGLRFKAKYIGSLEIARPTCKIDIITAMRRIRYEYKVKGIRKVRCLLEVSTSGVRVSKRKRRQQSKKRYSQEQLFVMQHPIYRIFYVSHDSQDLKIFSYITREVPDNTFRCNVFKAYRKGMALHIVRSLGQAFDVCHKSNPKPSKKKKKGEAGGEGENGIEFEAAKEGAEQEEGVVKEDLGSKATPTDLDSAMQKVSLQNGEAAKTEPTTAPSSAVGDLSTLIFDPFALPFPTAEANGAFLPPGFQNGSRMSESTMADPFQSNLTPLTVSNLPSNLPDFPDGVDPSKVTVPPPHLAYIGRPRPRASIGSQSGQTVENPFTESMDRGTSDSPVSIGEAVGLRTIPEDGGGGGGGGGRKTSNPFLPAGGGGGETWEREKHQFITQLTLMNEQLKAERASRVESQARVEQLLLQNKDLLSHLQNLTAQLQKLQSLGIEKQLSSLSPSPKPPSEAVDTPSPAPPAPSGDTHPLVTSPPPPPPLSSSQEAPPDVSSPVPTSVSPRTNTETPPSGGVSPLGSGPVAMEQEVSVAVLPDPLPSGVARSGDFDPVSDFEPVLRDEGSMSIDVMPTVATNDPFAPIATTVN